MSIDPEKLLHLAKRRHGPAGVTLSWPIVIKIVDELQSLRALVEDCRQEARFHAQEARTQRTTVQEIYQEVSGGQGEPGDWHGAEPVRKLVAERDALAAHVDCMRSAARRMAGPFEDEHDFKDALLFLQEAEGGLLKSSLARRDNEQFRQGFWWGFERARCNPEAMNIRAEFEEVQRLRRQSEEAPCSSTSPSASPSASC